ncbi:hypothetical protein BH23CHL1_BH23CHL1_10220 [soil metagenome]|jgi:hypothetical protein
MAYKATHDVVQRVMPLLEQMASRTIDKARLLQYLSASAGVDWGIMTVLSDVQTNEGRTISYRDELSGDNYQLRYPEFLSDDLAPLVLAEYKRLAVDKPLTKMDRGLFEHFFALTHCARCRYSGPEHTQIHSECHFAGFPVNFESE